MEPSPHPLTSQPLDVQIRRRDENQNVVIERQLYDSCGGRSDADFEYSLGSPLGGGGGGGGRVSEDVDHTYSWAAKLGKGGTTNWLVGMEIGKSL